MAGIGIIRRKFWDREGEPFIVEVEDFYIPECRVKLLGPQQYSRAMNGGRLIISS